MKIRSKVIALLAGLFAILGIAQLVVAQKIFLPSFSDLERQAARTDMDRALFTLRRETDLFAAMCTDWGNWDATYRYMNDHNADFIKVNMTASSIATYRANAVAYVDLTGKFLWSTAVDYRSGKSLALDLIARGHLAETPSWRNALKSGTTLSGLVGTNLGPMLLAMAPVLDGNGQGPHRGMVLLGRLLDATEIRRIGAQAQVQLTLLSSREFSQQTGEDLRVTDDFTQVYHPLRDIAEVPLLTLRIDVPRSISERGQLVVHFALIFLLCSAALVLLLTVLTLNRLVLSPLAQVTQHVVAVRHSNDLTARLTFDREDELGELAKEFVGMVDALAQARRQLVDHAFDAGIAENASGVLHNLGNAMTPLSVKVAQLQQSLKAAATGDIELVLAELAQADSVCDASRKADLEAFLHLASRELAKLVSQTEADVDVLARQVQSIQNVLTQQTRHTRSERMLETVRLPQLLEQSAELVAPALRQRLALTADASLAEIGAVRLARTTLQQVFQNFIVNAAEAAREDAETRGSLTVSARVLDDAGMQRMQIRFDDDGQGIPRENLIRIFEKGFSTKSSTTNSGIGLHWCANVVNALGGSLRAESAGAGQGSSLILTLPLQRADDNTIRNAA